MDQDKAVAYLVRASRTVVDAFRAGQNPTFAQLDRLDAALHPFVEFKVCGHHIIEECECAAIESGKERG